jgi:two-component system phosphate regulon response regulator PhoB
MARILVVDDEPSIVRLVTTTLRGRGHTVHEAHDGQEALDQTRLLEPDLIVLDIMMPVMDGREVRRRLLADPKTRAIPVIHLSAVGDFDEQLHAMDEVEGGFTDYFTKPFAPRELADRVDQVLDPETREKAARDAHAKEAKLRTIVDIMHKKRDSD